LKKWSFFISRNTASVVVFWRDYFVFLQNKYYAYRIA